MVKEQSIGIKEFRQLKKEIRGSKDCPAWKST